MLDELKTQTMFQNSDMELKIECGLNISEYKSTVMAHLNKISFPDVRPSSNNKKELCMLGWILYSNLGDQTCQN